MKYLLGVVVSAAFALAPNPPAHASLPVLHFDIAALAVLMAVAMTIAVLRFRRTLD